ncbi:hypothetical protein D7M11_28155 [Paenibacillus ginsengarvi]|uniref:Uncharacterized protein n=1 Tax=Paenibacillus ginsengarvi TaxID=400777 RepID=A0A3B0BLP2_9BACL|nr:hypothetical protein D7M11_28155 [Paenibacillus ginsengarvi]
MEREAKIGPFRYREGNGRPFWRLSRSVAGGGFSGTRGSAKASQAEVEVPLEPEERHWRGAIEEAKVAMAAVRPGKTGQAGP